MDAVDLVKYPGFSEVPWWEAQMEAGDCLYIPIFWHHQVTSTADPARKRNMAVNTWFFTLNRFNHSNCEAGSRGEVPLDTVAGTLKPKKSEIIRYTDRSWLSAPPASTPAKKASEDSPGRKIYQRGSPVKSSEFPV